MHQAHNIIDPNFLLLIKPDELPEFHQQCERYQVDSYVLSIRETHLKTAVIASYYITRSPTFRSIIAYEINKWPSLLLSFQCLFGNLGPTGFFGDKFKFNYVNEKFSLIVKENEELNAVRKVFISQ
jgi:hypothetical protein